MKISVEQTVTYSVHDVDIKTLRVFKDKSNDLVFAVNYQWLGGNGKSIRSDMRQYSQADLVSAFSGADITQMMNSISSLIPVEGIGQSLFVNLVQDPCSFRGMCVKSEMGKNICIAKTYTEKEISDSGLVMEEFLGAVTLLASSFTRD